MSYFLEETKEIEDKINSTICLECNSHLIVILADNKIQGICPVCDLVNTSQNIGGNQE